MKFGLTFFKKVQKFPQKWTGKVFFSIILGLFLTATLSVAPHKAQAQIATPPQITITDKGVTLDTSGKYSWKVHVSVNFGGQQVNSQTDVNMYTYDSTASSPVGIANKNPEVININFVSSSSTYEGDYTTGPIIEPNKKYSMLAQKVSSTGAISTAQSNFLYIVMGATGVSISTGTSNSAGVVTPTITASEPQCWISLSEGFSVSGCISQLVYYGLFVPTSFILALSGQLLDALLSYTLDSASYDMSTDGFIKVGWKLIRDICNVVFIFILLYAAISTILGTGGVDIKKTIGSVIIVALLINFSLFFSGIIVDAGNILGRVFYTAMGVSKSTTSGTPSSMDNLFSGGDKSISTAIVSQFNPQNLFAQSITQGFKIKGLGDQGSGTTTVNGDGITVIQPPPGIYAAISLILAIINIMTAWIFFVVSFVFIGRVVGIWLAMVFSPIAFLSIAAPGKMSSMFGTYNFSKWLGNLIDLAMTAPVFLFFLYLILKFLSAGFLTKAFTSGAGLGLNLTTMQTLIGVVLPFLIVWGLLLEAKKRTVALSGEVGGQFAAWGDTLGKLAVGGALAVGTGGAALAGRGIIGRGAAALSENQTLQKLKGKSGLTGYTARLALRGTDKLSKASFDARNSKAADMLKGSPMGIDIKKNIIGNSFLSIDDKNRGIAGSSKEGWQGMNKRREADIVKGAEERQLKGDAITKQDKVASEYKQYTEEAHTRNNEHNKTITSAVPEAIYNTDRDRARNIKIARGEEFDEEKFKETYFSKQGYKSSSTLEAEVKKTWEATHGENSTLTGTEYNKKMLDDYKEQVSKGNYGASGAFKQTIENVTGIDVNKATLPGSVKAGAVMSGVGGFNEKAQKSAIKAIDKKFNDKDLESVTNELKKIDDDIKEYLTKENLKEDEIKNLTNYQKQEKLTEIRKKKDKELREINFDRDAKNEEYKRERDPVIKKSLRDELLSMDEKRSNLRDEIDSLKNLFDRREKKQEQKEKIENKINPKDKKDEKKDEGKKDEKK